MGVLCVEVTTSNTLRSKVKKKLPVVICCDAVKRGAVYSSNYDCSTSVKGSCDTGSLKVCCGVLWCFVMTYVPRM